MKHNKLFIALVSIVLIFSSCNKNNTPDPIVPPEVEEPDGEDKPKEGIFVLSGRSGLAGADVLYTSSTLDEGVLVTAGTGGGELPPARLADLAPAVLGHADPDAAPR